MPIGMYIILNGTFVTCNLVVVSLTNKPKLLAMTQVDIFSGSSSINPDYALIEACRRGDQKAQLQIYKLYYKSIYSICLQIVNDPVTAEDIMHESFLSAFEKISTFPENTSFYSWLHSFIKYAF